MLGTAGVAVKGSLKARSELEMVGREWFSLLESVLICWYRRNNVRG